MSNNRFSEKGFKLTKSRAIKAAKDLFYGDSVIDALEEADSIGAIEHIMVSARKTTRPGYKEGYYE